jgi:hypothetical protein
MHRQFIVAIEAKIGQRDFAISASLFGDGEAHIIVAFGAEAGAIFGYHWLHFGITVLMLMGARCQARLAKIMEFYRQVAAGGDGAEILVQ